MRYLSLAAFTLLGCAASDRITVRAPDGGIATLVSCRNYEACLEEASEGCPFGYDVLSDRDESTVGGYYNADTGVGIVGTKRQSKMLIRCWARTTER